MGHSRDMEQEKYLNSGLKGIDYRAKALSIHAAIISMIYLA